MATYMTVNLFRHFPYVSVSASIFQLLNLPFLSQQLIPGHEAVGSIVELGKNVKGFALGDRCVADVGITVGWKRDSTTRLTATSVTNAFIVAGVSPSCVKTSVRAE
jgi:threonine dehydrogenase-like Zn-dependent dehydrogenase